MLTFRPVLKNLGLLTLVAAALLACEDPEEKKSGTPPAPTASPLPTTSSTLSTATTTTGTSTTATGQPDPVQAQLDADTAARTAQELSKIPIHVPRTFAEPTTDQLKAARAKLPVGAPEDAELVYKIDVGKRGGRLVYGSLAEIKSFNPVFTDSADDQEAQSLMFAGLYGYDQYEQKDMPALAKSWSYDKPTRTWTFNIRKGLKWSDGQPLTADDFLFFTQLVFDPKIENEFHFGLRKEPKKDSPPYVFTVPDPCTLKVVIPSDDAFSFENLGEMRAVPRHALEASWKNGTFKEQWLQGMDPKDLVVSGPYKLKTIRSGEVMIFERNPYYWRYDMEGQQLPYLDELVLPHMTDMQAMHLRFLAGDFDLMAEGVSILPELLPKFIDFQKMANYTVYALGGNLNVNHYFFNQHPGGTYVGADGKRTKWQPSKPGETAPADLKGFKPYINPIKRVWFANAEFRRACSEATNRQRMIDTVLFGQGQPLYGFISPANKEWFNPNSPQYKFDPAAAKARLDKLGWIDRDGDGIREDAQGNPIRFTIATNKENNIRMKILQLLVQDLKSVGIGAEQQVLDFNVLITRVKDTFDYDCILMGLATGVPPHPAMDVNTIPSSGENHFGFPKQTTPMSDWEAKIDTLYSQMKHTFDPAEQKRVYNEILATWDQQQPEVSLFIVNAFTAAKNKFGNIKPAIVRVSLTHNVDEIYLK